MIDSPTCSTLGIVGKGVGKALAGQKASCHVPVSAISGLQMRPAATAKTVIY
jgi:hypothetical protein